MQSLGKTYENVGSLMSAMHDDFKKFLQLSTQNGFKSAGISDIVIDEIIMATIRVNYGQNLKIHKMVGEWLIFFSHLSFSPASFSFKF